MLSFSSLLFLCILVKFSTQLSHFSTSMETFSISSNVDNIVHPKSDCELVSFIPRGNASCCLLENIVCNENGRITALRFNSSNLYSLEPISHLSELVILDLSNNKITNMDSVSKLTNLRQLYLQGNLINGTLEPLSGLVNLEYLHLEYNFITGSLDYIANLRNLTVLFVGSNMITGTMDHVAGLTNLEQLSIDFNLLTGTLEAVRDLIHLTYLYVSHNEISGTLEPLKNLVNLNFLNFANNRLAGALNYLSNLTGMIHLNGAANFLSGSLESLRQLSMIAYIDLDSNLFNGTLDSLSSLTSLNYLFLDCNNLTGNLHSLSNLTNLIQLNLSVNFLQGDLAAITKMKLLTKLSLFDNDLSGTIDLGLLFTDPKAVHVLRLDDNWFSGSVSLDFRLFTSINEFNISSNLFNEVLDVNFPSQSVIIDTRDNNFDCPYPIAPSHAVFLTSPCNSHWTLFLYLVGYLFAFLIGCAVFRFFVLRFFNCIHFEENAKLVVTFFWARISIVLNLIFYYNVLVYLVQDRASCSIINMGGIFGSFMEYGYELPEPILPTTPFYDFMQVLFSTSGNTNNAVVTTNLADFKNLCSLFPGCGFVEYPNWFGCALVDSTTVRDGGHVLFFWIVVCSLIITVLIMFSRSFIVLLSVYLGYIPMGDKLYDYVSSDPFTFLLYFFQPDNWKTILNYKPSHLDLSVRIFFDGLLCNLPRWFVGLYYIQIVQTGYSFVDLASILSGLFGIAVLIFQFIYAYYVHKTMQSISELDEFSSFKPDLLEKLVERDYANLFFQANKADSNNFQVDSGSNAISLQNVAPELDRFPLVVDSESSSLCNGNSDAFQDDLSISSLDAYSTAETIFLPE